MNTGTGIDLSGEWFIGSVNTTNLIIGKKRAIVIDNTKEIPDVLINGFNVKGFAKQEDLAKLQAVVDKDLITLREMINCADEKEDSVHGSVESDNYVKIKDEQLVRKDELDSYVKKDEQIVRKNDLTDYVKKDESIKREELNVFVKKDESLVRKEELDNYVKKDEQIVRKSDLTDYVKRDELLLNKNELVLQCIEELSNLRKKMIELESFEKESYNVFSLFGNGVDGDISIIDSGKLERDMYYNNLIVAKNAHLNTNGYRIFVRNKLTLFGNISGDGEDSFEHLGGKILPNGTLGIGGAGMDSTDYVDTDITTSIIQTSGIIVENSVGGRGGKSGKYKKIKTDGIPCNQISTNDGGVEILNRIENAISGRNLNNVLINGGSGGGCGTHGGSGGGGRVVVVVVHTAVIEDESSITAIGGNGGESLNGGSAGGGGGGGCVIVVLHNNEKNDIKKHINISGGNGGGSKREESKGEKGYDGKIIIHRI